MAGTITALKTQKRKRNRVNIYLDERFAFGLASHLAVPLRRGQFLSDEEIAHLKEEDEFRQVYERATKFIAYRPRSEAEVRRRMERQGVVPDLAERVIEQLTTVGLLNDTEFAQLWIENRETFRPRSRHMLRYELRRKGLDDEAFSEALEQVNEEESARRLALQQGRRLSRLDWPTFRRKLTGYLTRRGFPYEIARDVIREAWESLSEDNFDTPDSYQEREDEE